ncbi:MAG: hypothetical protein J1E36_06490 [Eubacterium sp.]|nr:hypothetical protein [Eubacterium sp.]
MERKLNAELWDKMHYLFRDFNDRMVHVELHYDYEIDIEALKTVLVCFFEKAPVLHSSFTDNRIHPFWTVKNYNIDDVLTVKDVSEEDLEQEINDFLVQYIPPEADIQMHVAVFRHSGKSVLCVVENHMCMDGGDLKYFMKALCKNYNDFLEKGISPVELRTGTRSYESVYEDFSTSEKQFAKHLYKNINSKDNHGFPFTPDSIKDKSFIAKRKISASKFDEIRAAGKKHGATINDMLLTAYFYALYELADFDNSESVSISCAVDLRRHIKDNSDQGITNHTAWMQCKVPERGRTIFDTLNYVVASSNKFKEDKFIGLHGLPLLSFGYKILPLAASEEVIKIGYANPLLAMSNIGILEVDKLALAGNEPTDGFMSGAVKYKPYALLSVTSVRKELTISMCVRGNEEDKKTVDKFFDLIVKSIDLLTEG